MCSQYRSLLAVALFGLMMAANGQSTDQSGSTAATVVASNASTAKEASTTGMPDPATTTPKCDEAAEKKMGGCCMPFKMTTNTADTQAVITKALEEKYKNDNSTRRAAEEGTESEVKECEIPLYKIKANVTVTPFCAEGETCKNSTQTLCTILANYKGPDFTLRKMQCGSSSALRPSVNALITLLLPVLCVMFIKR